MVRRYDARPVDPAVVERMLANAVRAPSAGYTQGWAFLVLDQPCDVDRFWAVTTPDSDRPDDRWLSGMRTAPVIVVPLSSKSAYLDRYAEDDKGWRDREERRWPVPYWHIDTGMATLLMLQTAVDEGLGACFFGIPREQVEIFRTEFGVPASYTPIGAVTVGHRTVDSGAPGSPSSRPRKPLDEVVHRGGW
jgi:nitroreductase